MYQDPHKFIDHRFCESGDFMLLICHMNSCEHMLKGLCAFMGGSPLAVSLSHSTFLSHWSSASGEILYLICHMISRDHVIIGPSIFIIGSSSLYIPTLTSLVALDIVVVEIY